MIGIFLVFLLYIYPYISVFIGVVYTIFGYRLRGAVWSIYGIVSLYMFFGIKLDSQVKFGEFDTFSGRDLWFLYTFLSWGVILIYLFMECLYHTRIYLWKKFSLGKNNNQ